MVVIGGFLLGVYLGGALVASLTMEVCDADGENISGVSQWTVALLWPILLALGEKHG